MYHYTRDLAYSRYPNIKGLDYELFRQQLDYFKQNFNIVTMEQVMEAWDSGGETQDKKLPEKAILLTFDDGYIDNYTTAFPLLKEKGMQGSFFIPGKTFTENVLLDVNKIHFILASAANDRNLMNDVLREAEQARSSGYDIASNEELIRKYAKPNRWDTAETIFVKRMLQTVLPEEVRNQISSRLFAKYVGIEEDKFARELYMNRDQIRLMRSEGMFIGLHGYDHYWLGNLPEEEMHRDIGRALDVMDEFIDREAWVMNYPYGSYSDNVESYIRKRGCRIGLTCDVGAVDLVHSNPLRIPRFDCNDFPPKSGNYLNL